MFTSVGTAIRQLFAAITVLFTAAEHSANAVNHLAIWGEETAAAFSDEARSKRNQQLAILKAELRAVENKAAKVA